MMHHVVKKKRHSRLNALSVATMLRALLEGATSMTELHDVSGLSITTIRTYVNTLLKEKCIHVSAWDYDAHGKPSIRVFTLGHGKSVDRPKKDKAQIMREVRARKKVQTMNKTMNRIVAISDTPLPAESNFKYDDNIFGSVPLLTEKPLTQEEIWGSDSKKVARV